MSNVTIRRDGNVVTLIVDGRETVRHFDTEQEAIAVYQEYKTMIDEAAKEANKVAA